MLWVVLSNAVLVGYQFIQLVFISRFFGGSAVGDFGYALAIVSPVQVFWMANLKSLVQSSSVSELDLPIIYTGRFVQAVLFLVSIALCLAILSLPAGLVFAVALAKSVEMMFDLRGGFYVRSGCMKRLAVCQLFRVLVMATSFYSVAVYTRSIFLGIIVGVLAVLPLLAYESRGLLMFRSIKAAFNNVFNDIPLGLVAVCESLLALLPRFVLMASAGAAAVGAFTVTYYLISAFNVVVQGVSICFARRFHSGGGGFFYPIAGILLFGFFVTLLSYLFGDVFISLIFGVDVSGGYVAGIVLSGVFAYIYVFIYGVAVDRISRLLMVAVFSLVVVLSYFILLLAVDYSSVVFSFTVAATRAMQLLVVIVMWCSIRDKIFKN